MLVVLNLDKRFPEKGGGRREGRDKGEGVMGRLKKGSW